MIHLLRSRIVHHTHALLSLSSCPPDRTDGLVASHFHVFNHRLPFFYSYLQLLSRLAI
jgi:hypothetical protein